MEETQCCVDFSFFAEKRSQLLYHSEAPPRALAFCHAFPHPADRHNSEGKDGWEEREDTEGGAENMNMKAVKLRAPPKEKLDYTEANPQSGLGLARQSPERNAAFPLEEQLEVDIFHDSSAEAVELIHEAEGQLISCWLQPLLCLLLFCAHSFHVAGTVCLLYSHNQYQLLSLCSRLHLI